MNYILKNNTMKTKALLMFAAVAIFSLLSCNKQTGIDQTSVTVADDDAVGNAVFEDVSNTVDMADITLDNYQAGTKSLTVTDSCPSVTIDHPADAIWPKTITVDYGTACTGFYNNTRSGKIVIVVTGPRKTTGSIRTITFDNYYFNGIKVEGTKTIETMGYNSNQNMVFKVKLADGKLTLPNNTVIERSFDHQREWIAGFNTRNIWDDEVLITGTASGVTINGVAYTNTITTALHWTRACKFIVSGIIDIESEGKESIVLDFGSGSCDAVATVTKGGETKEITLKHKYRVMGR
jgi:hypothetical protein